MSRTFHFEDRIGPVPAHRHRHPNGTLGGWVADTAFVARTAYVSPKARVFDSARVLDSARISGNARVSGAAEVSERACVFDNAKVYDSARISGSAQVYDHAEVSGGARIFDKAQIYGAARVCGIGGKISGSVLVSGRATIYDGALIEKQEDLRVGAGWTAYRTQLFPEGTTGVLVVPVPELWAKQFAFWPDNLPRVLLDCGLISTMEYLVQALELDRAS